MIGRQRQVRQLVGLSNAPDNRRSFSEHRLLCRAQTTGGGALAVVHWRWCSKVQGVFSGVTRCRMAGGPWGEEKLAQWVRAVDSLSGKQQQSTITNKIIPQLT